MTAIVTRRHLFALAACAVPISGCATAAPRVLDPTVARSRGDLAQSSGRPVQNAEWWREVEDPALDQLVATALADSPDLRESWARLSRAEAQMRVSGAALGPQAGLGGQFDAQRLSPEVTDRFDELDPHIGQARLQLQGSWELDFWGKASSGARADAFGYLGAGEALQAGRASLIGQVATAYADLRIFDERLVCARQGQAARQGLFDLARVRRQAGVADVSEVGAAQAELAQQLAAVTGLDVQRSQTGHALALLVGRTTETLESMLKPAGAIPLAPPSPAAGLPNDLLRNRPDLLQAEYAALAQYARLESARAGLYPSFSLQGALGTSSSTLADGSITDLFSWDRRLLSAGLAISMPLFNRGRLVAEVDVQDAALIEAIAAYEGAVSGAQRDVLDALAQDAGARRAAARAAEGLAARRRQTAVSQARLEAGDGLRSDRLEASLVENTALDADIQARGDMLKAWIALNRALGSGARA